MEKYKVSKYNHFIVKNDTSYGVNFRKKSSIRIYDKEFSNDLRELTDSNAKEFILNKLNITEETFNSLEETGFIINDTFDEISEIKFNYRRSLYDSSALRLIILPTLSCNFDCPYCFEYKNSKRIDSVARENLIKWVSDILPSKRNLHVSWFGGEPLLEKKNIYTITKELKEKCAELGCEYRASMTTNGYYIDDIFIKTIEELSLTHIQITFDGDEDFHNRYRSLKSGKPSFDTLLQNTINFAQNAPKSCSLGLRINCTDENYNSITSLLKKFPGEVKDCSRIFFRWVYATEAKNFKDFSSNLKGSDPYKGLHDLYNSAKSMGFKIRNPHSSFKLGYCEVDFLDHFLIDPSGNIYLCSHTMNPNEAIGALSNSDSIIDKNKMNEVAKWFTREPFDDQKCITCKLLPICLGGCRKTRYEGGRACIDEIRSLDNYVAGIISESSDIV